MTREEFRKCENADETLLPPPVQLGSSNGVGVHFFLLDEQSSKMNRRIFQPRPAAELIATRVITAFQKRLYRPRRYHADRKSGPRRRTGYERWKSMLENFFRRCALSK